MRMRRVLSAFLAVICSITSIGFCTLGAFAEDTKPVYAITSESVAQGSYAYGYVYLDDLTDLSALTVSVHYDTSRVTVHDSYNNVECTVYDSSNKDGCLQFSYIFDGNGSNTKVQLFYFQYQVNSTAQAGDTYFDIVVSDAYNASLDVMNIGGSRCPFTITENDTAESCSIFCSSAVSTGVKKEFTLSYMLSTSQIASGSFEISYDRELFEFVELTMGGFLDGKVTDVNSSLDGTVAASFVGTEYNYNYDLVTVKFRTVKNVDEVSDIKLTVKELYDLDLNPISCNGYTTKATVVFDEAYTEDSPSIMLNAIYDDVANKVIITITLEKDSHLGAGDFVLGFDTTYMTYASVEKGFSPTFFNINEKHVADGILKFSIISVTDIIDEQTVITVTFDTKRNCEASDINFEFKGSGLTDALGNSIMLNMEYEMKWGCEIHGHKYEGWTGNHESHWHECTRCGAKLDTAKHVYSGADDIKCDICDYAIYIPGDLTGDELMDTDDAIYLMMSIFFPDQYPRNQICDFNNSGSVDTDDAIYLMMAVFFPDQYPVK